MATKISGKNNQEGFTLLEILMAVLLISILAAVGITQFVNFSKDTKNAATLSDLSIIRNAITAKAAQMQLDCGATPGTWPSVGNLTANDITASTTGGCTTTQVPNSSDRSFFNGSAIPINPWGVVGTNQNSVTDCQATGTKCVQTAGIDCLTTAAMATTGTGWCYNSVSGQFWANSANNNGGAVSTVVPLSENMY